jgi:hypothetical protein
MKREQVTIPEFHRRLLSQGVSTREHFALVCPVCGTVQSIASLRRAGAPEDRIEGALGFSCEGRFSNVGTWPSAKDCSAKADERRGVRGCDWTLGGLFQLHELEVIADDGTVHPRFRVATPEEARALQFLMTGPAEGVPPIALAPAAKAARP